MKAARLAICAWLLLAGVAHAHSLIMTRVTMPAEKAFAWLTSSIEEHGYKVVHVQTCDQGMAEFGYKTDFYRVVFFGKHTEVRWISKDHPEFTPYLPLKIAVVAERGETVMTAINPHVYDAFFPGDRKMQTQFVRWYNDLHSIFADVQKAANEQPQAEQHSVVATQPDKATEKAAH